MAVYYLVTPKQWNKLNEGSKPRFTTEKEKGSLEEFYLKINCQKVK
jgi:hypothetical protein